ncbi:hypothetical protein EKA85_30845 [Pseudomonas veronii]|jgi:hypothetical protein|nr:hypothetical protein EKA85_30845 [Pseudomonas veronii]RTY65330.1 hypothetical protein EKA83_30960 [Pseudomonas veronii]
MSVKTRLTTKVQPELQRGRIMPQFCRFLGVNSVTNIELPKGFMPVLICFFADWLENFFASDRHNSSSRKPLLPRGLGRISYRDMAFCPCF